jgi:putative membrane protein
MLKKFFIQLVINAFAFFIAITVMRGHGIQPQQANVVEGYLVMALIFAVINAIVRPILAVLGCPVIILTLGLGILLLNTLMFYLTGLIGTKFGFGFTVDGFWPAFLGALIVSAIGVVLNIVFHKELKD